MKAMISLPSLGVILTAAITVFAHPYSQPEERASQLLSRQTPSSSGYHDGWYYKYWTDGEGPHNYTNLPGGKYSLNWAFPGNFYGGKGWEKGRIDRKIHFEGTYSPNGNSMVSVYGSMNNPWIEYYIVENFGTHNPGSEGVYKGTVTTDGGTYGVYRSVRYGNGLSVPTLLRYWSVRYNKRVIGTITMKNHFDAWTRFGMNLGTVQDFQILAVEGYYSSGKANFTIS